MCVCVCVCVTVHGGVRVSVRAGPLSLMFEKANRVAQLVSSLKHTHAHTHTHTHTETHWRHLFFFLFPKVVLLLLCCNRQHSYRHDVTGYTGLVDILG